MENKPIGSYAMQIDSANTIAIDDKKVAVDIAGSASKEGPWEVSSLYRSQRGRTISIPLLKRLFGTAANHGGNGASADKRIGGKPSQERAKGDVGRRGGDQYCLSLNE